MYPQLDIAMQFRLDKINKIKDYFVAEISERETMSKRLSKYVAAFGHVEKTLLVLSTRNGGVSIASLLLLDIKHMTRFSLFVY